ncbi:MAG: hypothetical protein LBS97_04720 [Treponema sp.]|jgi:hypothetical protein|nr:hypothetical protein [Treponema sp.]
MKQFVRPLLSPLFFLCLFVLPATLRAESFHVRKIYTGDLNGRGPVSFLVEIDEGVQILLPADRTFLKAIELELKIPAGLAGLQDTLTYAFYREITPALSGFVTEYQGFQIYSAPVPNRVGLTIGIPYGAAGTLQTTPYITVVPAAIGKETESIFFLLRQEDKNAPPDFSMERVSVTVKPVFESKGFLELLLTYRKGREIKPVEHPYTVFIDSQPVSHGFGILTLDTGTHHLAIVSDFYRNVVKSFSVAQGKASRVEVELMDITPTVVIDAPETSILFLDDVQITPGDEPFLLAQGEHTLRILVGGYEIRKTIHTENSKSYRISVFFDAEIQEIR